MNKTIETLTKNNVGYTLDTEGNICGLSFGKESKLTDSEAWAFVEKNNLKTSIISEKPILDEPMQIEDIKAKLEELTIELSKYENT